MHAIQNYLLNLNPIYQYLGVFILSMVPVVEQRGAIPMGILLLKLNPFAVLIVSLLGSAVPVPFILLLFNLIFDWMKKYKVFEPFNNFIDKKLKKNTPRIERFKEIGLITFVAIPLPTTGLWTGSAVAAVIGLDFKKSFFCAFTGGVISAIVITLLSTIFS